MNGDETKADADITDLQPWAVNISNVFTEAFGYDTRMVDMWPFLPHANDGTASFLVEKSEVCIASTSDFTTPQRQALVDAMHTLAASGVTIVLVDMTQDLCILRQCLGVENKKTFKKACSLLSDHSCDRSSSSPVPRVFSLPLGPTKATTSLPLGKLGFTTYGKDTADDYRTDYVKALRLFYSDMDLKIVIAPVGMGEAFRSLQWTHVQRCVSSSIRKSHPWYKALRTMGMKMFSSPTAACRRFKEQFASNLKKKKKKKKKKRRIYTVTTT